MHAHRIKILDRADDDAIVLAVAHDLHFEFFPTEQRLFDQQLVRGRQVEPALAQVDELVLVVGDAASGTAQGERRADHRRKPDRRLHFVRLCKVMRDPRARRSEADAGHRRLELFPVFGLVDRLFRSADQLDIEARQHAFAREVQCTIERGLSAHGWQQRVGPLALDHFGDHRPGNGLDVSHVGHPRIGHDRRRIGIDQDDLVAFLAQSRARLSARIVELARLANDDRACPDDENALDVAALRHGLCEHSFSGDL